MLATSYNSAAHRRRGTNLLELLLALAILTGALYPLVYIFRMAIPAQQKTQTELLATLLAHHVMETIVAKKLEDPDYLPQMTEVEPLVMMPGSVAPVSEYFRHMSDSGGILEREEDSELYWPLHQYKCQVDTYYLEGSLYKVIVYISYEQDGRTMRVFLERLFAQPHAQTMGAEDEM